MNSHKTAIRRDKISAPAEYLKSSNLLIGRILDYGCGRGKDCEVLKISGYDPYWQPKLPDGQFETILCTFVLNTLSTDQEQEVLNNISNILTKDGKAYITVRRDIKQEGRTNKGTYQRNVLLDLPEIYTRKNKFTIYLLEKK